jgi:hypothetical protein
VHTKYEPGKPERRRLLRRRRCRWGSAINKEVTGIWNQAVDSSDFVTITL